VRLTVVDSLPTGYKMEYTFLEFQADSTIDSSLSNIQYRIVEKLGKKIVGTTIHFETDDFGAITKINNLGQIKRQAKSLFNESMKELMQLPEIATLKKDLKLDIKALIKEFDTDKLVDGYLEELKLIFLCHGNIYEIGQSHIHEDATATSYENDTYSTVTLDPEDYTYNITTDVINIIPFSELKDIVGGLIDSLDSDMLTELFNKEFETQVKENAIYESYFSSDFMAHGWPYKIITQTNVTIDGRGKSNQTYIYLDDINW
ncbi:MAG: hypothetical protein K2N91_08520, partial [Muribaculaceae bacterium]|nr:hypothetical protein [Muribaculaceae bacterium]